MHGAQDATLSNSWANTARGTATREGSYPSHEGRHPACAAPSRLGRMCSSPPLINAHVTPFQKIILPVRYFCVLCTPNSRPLKKHTYSIATSV